MRPRARIAVWVVVAPVAVLLVGFIVFSIATHRSVPAPPSIVTPGPVAPVQPSLLPTATSGPATAGQSPTITGAWIGTLGQPGGPFPTYTFSMTLTEAATGAVSGSARADAPNQPQYFIVEAVVGQVAGNVFSFQRQSVLQSAPSNHAWCIDSGQLTVSPDSSTLNGTWQGQGCGSGPIGLTRAPA